ncbi:MAG: PqqD family protein [Calditrichaceae bacterium]
MKPQNMNDLLQCRPVPLMEWYMDEESGRVIIKRPRFLSPTARKIIGPFMKSSHFLVKLDELGSVVWKNCDGSNSVQNIGERLLDNFGTDLDSVWERVSKFILQLKREKFIDLEFD